MYQSRYFFLCRVRESSVPGFNIKISVMDLIMPAAGDQLEPTIVFQSHRTALTSFQDGG